MNKVFEGRKSKLWLVSYRSCFNKNYILDLRQEIKHWKIRKLATNNDSLFTPFTKIFI